MYSVGQDNRVVRPPRANDCRSGTLSGKYDTSSSHSLLGSTDDMTASRAANGLTCGCLGLASLQPTSLQGLPAHAQKAHYVVFVVMSRRGVPRTLLFFSLVDLCFSNEVGCSLRVPTAAPVWLIPFPYRTSYYASTSLQPRSCSYSIATANMWASGSACPISCSSFPPLLLVTTLI